MESRWPDGRTECVKCGVERKHYRVTGRTAFACEKCGNHIYPLAGTIFEKSSTSLVTWFYVIYQMGATRCGVSAKQIQRETGVTYKCAWRMCKQVRSLMSEDIQLTGPKVEVDETYYGGRAKGLKGRPQPGHKKKTLVFGMVERKGRVIAKTIESVSTATLRGTIWEKVLPSATVYTDEWSGYNTISENRRYTHKRINHSAKVYVMGDIHTNTIEGFWSLIKRGISGVYHSVGKDYLQSYLDEYSFRYNRRNAHDPMFISLLERVSELAD